ncbi:methionyl-tRNA formyltransferase [Roseivirga echinicomitans]|uniref:Formyl transferase C-terminal domain-containing protein n=1 Tax=Roseivirga echinicomitans TaxID=296218 RepID=A0A150XRB8_9BACT|nr:formyltransferase family protein [Roseivirga echinicomitans]KYG81132.1 hypothetical protein AWN68_16470 [Roseivirga echinicomitans]
MKKIVMCGCHVAGYEAIGKMLASGLKIDYFVLVDKSKAERLQISGYIDYEPLAKAYGIPVYYVSKYTLNSAEDIEFFKRNEFDLLIQGGWQRLFPSVILDTLSIGAIGGHGSVEFLPKGRGRSPINWSLINGAERFIVHYFLIRPGIDNGDVFFYQMFDINQWDDVQSLYLKMSMITHRMYMEWVPKLLIGDFTVQPQVGIPTYFGKRTPEDGIIDWNKPLMDIYNFVRALTKPYPGAFSFINDKKVTLYRVSPFDTRLDVPGQRIGEIVEVFQDGSFLIKCHGGLLRVTDYLTDLSIKVGMVFDSSPDIKK